jgi:hypothetical protein
MTNNEFSLVMMTLEEAGMIPHRDYETMANISFRIFGRRELCCFWSLPLDTSKEAVIARTKRFIRNEL